MSQFHNIECSVSVCLSYVPIEFKIIYCSLSSLLIFVRKFNVNIVIYVNFRQVFAPLTREDKKNEFILL